MKKILTICSGNKYRSVFAEKYINENYKKKYIAKSVGTIKTVKNNIKDVVLNDFDIIIIFNGRSKVKDEIKHSDLYIFNVFNPHNKKNKKIAIEKMQKEIINILKAIL